MKLVIAATIAPREDKQNNKKFNYFKDSKASLAAAGFSEPIHTFLEPGAYSTIEGLNGIIPHENKKLLGCFRNFAKAARWVIDNTDGDWFMLLQDDALWLDNSAQVIYDTIKKPESASVGFFSPYTSKAMVFDKDKNKNGWVDCRFHNKAFWGAVAMLFPRESLTRLVAARRFVNHKHMRKLDVVVGNTIRRDLDLPIKMHVPSLVQHIGQFSTLGRHKLKGNQWGRKGFRFGA